MCEHCDRALAGLNENRNFVCFKCRTRKRYPFWVYDKKQGDPEHYVTVGFGAERYRVPRWKAIRTAPPKACVNCGAAWGYIGTHAQVPKKGDDKGWQQLEARVNK